MNHLIRLIISLRAIMGGAFAIVNFLAMALPGAAATNISGVQNGNVTWSVAYSPYTVTGDVQVPAGSTLTINPGVTVKYAGAYQIYVQGTLIANGTSGSPILFGSTNAGVSSGATMLKFEGTNLTNLQLSYVQMSDAAKAIMVGGGGGWSNPGVACTGILTVSHASITNAEVRTGGYQTSARLVLDHSTVTNATIIGQYPSSEPIDVTASTVTNSVINSDSYNLGITLTNTTVTGSQLKMGCCGANLTVLGGTVDSSTIMEGGGSPVNGPLMLSNVTLTDTTVNLPSAQCAISGCAFTFAASPGIRIGNGTVTDSTFTGSGGGTLMEVTGYNGYDLTGGILITGSTFTDSAVALKFTGAKPATIHSSVFARNASYNLENRSGTSVNATGNNWGSADVMQVAQKIFDMEDDINIGSVTIIDPALLAITGQPSNQTIAPGGNAGFVVAATGTPAPTYQWYKNGSPISGATSATLSLGNVQNADAASYVVSVTNTAGSLVSSGAILTVSAGGPTNISGVQNGNVTWSVVYSPYTVTGDVQVPAGSTLTINPGVTVKYAGAYQIYVQGTLIANGTSGSPIIFGSTNAGVSSGATMLKFEGTNLTNSQLSYVQMSDAAKAVMVGGGGGEFNHGLACTGILTVSHASITNAEVRTGGYQTGARMVLDHATVTNATIEGQYPLSEPIDVSNSTVSDSVITSDSYNLGITLTNTTVTGSQLKMGCCGANLTVLGGTVDSSTIMEGGGSPVNGPLMLSNVTLTNTTVNLPSAQCAISGCAFTFAASPGIRVGNGTVTGSTFTGSGGGLLMEVTGYNGYDLTGAITITGCTFSDSAVALKLTGAKPATIHSSVFARNSSYNLENRSNTSVNATGNNWGSADALQVAQKIFDRADDINIGSVTTIDPALLAITGQPSNQTVTPGGNANFVVAATGVPAPTYEWYKNGVLISGATTATLSIGNTQNVDAATYMAVITNSAGSLLSAGAILTVSAGGPTNISGVQNGNVTWSVAYSPYTVTGDVQVPAGSTLTINPGVTVKYAGAYQIYVQGTLIANGTVGSPIIFGSTNAGVSSGATMLKFEGTNLSDSQLSYVQMSDAAKAIMVGGGGGEFNHGLACAGILTVSHASITNAEVRTGGYQTSARLVLDHSTVTNATIIGQYPLSEPIDVTASTVTNSVINSDSYNVGITLTNTTVTGSQLKMGCCGANLALVGGTVSDSTVTTTNSGDGPFSIMGTTLTNTTIALPGTPVTITGATFTYTSGAASPKLQFMSGTISNTTVAGNGGGVGLEFGSGYGNVTVSGTTITGFATGLRFSGVRTSSTVRVQPDNVFSGITTFNLDNHTNMTVAARGNDWGTTDETQIALKIFDGIDDITFGIVDTHKLPQLPVVVSSPTSGTFRSKYMATANGGSGLGAFTWALGVGSTAPGAAIDASTGSITSMGAGTVVIKVTKATDDDYLPTTSADFTVVLAKATPVITWPTPATITNGTPLSSIQLNATTDVAGTFSYFPGSGKILSVGVNTLSVTFVPVDGTNYNSAGAQKALEVTALPGKLSSGKRSVLLMNGTISRYGEDIADISDVWRLTGGGDFNDDGQVDILLQNSVTGQHVIWLMTGMAHNSTVDLGTTDPTWQTAGIGDFNGDGKPDILWQNTVTGQHSIWLMSGTTNIGNVELPTTDPIWRMTGTGDFNQDGQTDILWQNIVTGQHSIWLMNGTINIGNVELGTTDPTWRIMGTGDFNGDGKTDVLWQNMINGQMSLWLMNGTVVISASDFGDADPNWQAAGVGDFDHDGKVDVLRQRKVTVRNDLNGDGFTDILWQNTVTGQHSIWLMNGTTYLGGYELSATDPTWQIAGTGDFDADGQTDILWHNLTTGQHSVWLMHGTTYSGGVELETTDPVWQIAGTGDFDDDGQTDILFQNLVTGQHSIWLMNRTTHTGTVDLTTTNPAWQMVGSGDFNADGHTDILWQNIVTGEHSLWLMTGTVHTGTVDLGTTSPLWQMAGTGDFNADGSIDILWQNTATGQHSIWLMHGTTVIGNTELGTTDPAWVIVN